MLPTFVTSKSEYIAYPNAVKVLAENLDATPDEIAMWLFLGQQPGGLTAYLNANELDPPPQFHIECCFGNANTDYLAPLMGCWFNADEIANFHPVERYVTCKALIERWSKQPNMRRPEAFILAKIRESRLIDLHPIYGGTEATFSGIGSFPPLETGLFALSQIEEIEREDFGVDPNTLDKNNSLSQDAPKADGTAEIGSPEWRAQNARNAANVLHDKPGGSREKKNQIREIWATGKYTNRDLCAEQECAAIGMSFSVARKALINAPPPPQIVSRCLAPASRC